MVHDVCCVVNVDDRGDDSSIEGCDVIVVCRVEVGTVNDDNDVIASRVCSGVE